MHLRTRDIPPGPGLTRDVEPLIMALRPALTRAAFTEFAREAHAQGLVFTGAYVGDTCLGVAAHRVLATSRGRLLFVDDLVVAPDARSAGVGAHLMGEMSRRARESGCVRIELDSGVDNERAHRFYQARGMRAVALHFAGEPDGPGPDVLTGGGAPLTPSGA